MNTDPIEVNTIEVTVKAPEAEPSDRPPKLRSQSSTVSTTKPGRSNLVAAKAKEIKKLVHAVDDARKKQKNQRRKSMFSDAKSEEDMLAERLGEKHWRLKLLKVLQSHFVQMALTSLLVLDIVIVLVEIFVEAEYPSCSRIKRDATSCCPAGATGGRLLGGGGSADEPLCVSPLAPKIAYQAGCDGHKYPGVHAMHQVCFVVSATVLCLFEAELLATLTALGILFLKNPLYMLDIVVVTASLVLDFHLHLGTASSGESGATVLIVARCWRFVRVIHGVMSSSHERDMEALKETLEVAKELEEEAEELHREVTELEKQLEEFVAAVENSGSL